MSGIGFTVLYYLIFSIFFDTPIENELKNSNRRLVEHYDELTESYDSLALVLAEIKDRDNAVYKIIYEAEPYQDTLHKRDENLAAKLATLSNRELSKMLFDRLDTLVVAVDNINTSQTQELEKIDTNRAVYNRIPSIQPIDNKNLTLLAASFGNRIHPFYKSKHFHKGVDYAVPVGTAVFATADGKVEKIEKNGQSTGLSIKLNHQNGFKTFYANLDKVLVRAGASVLRGDIIAFSGNSGLSYAPHLHYEVELDGESIDPIPYFFAELNMEQSARMRRLAEVAMQSFD